MRRMTRGAARAAAVKLRRAGLRGELLVLQWQPLGAAAAIMRDWGVRYDADPVRRAQLTAVAERYAADERYLARQLQARQRLSPRTVGAPPPFAASDELLGLQSWYDAMAPTWLSIEPLLRRALVLKTHRWSAEHILIPAADGLTSAAQIREATAGLGEGLIEMIPPDDRGVWSVWVGLVVGDLQRALHRPSGDWNQAWARWLLLIAYSVPVPRERSAPVWPAKLTSLSALLH